jgi:hypothetical protein
MTHPASLPTRWDHLLQLQPSSNALTCRHRPTDDDGTRAGPWKNKNTSPYYHLLFEAQAYSRKAICLCLVPGVV